MDRVAFVTGAASGLGRAIALRLGSEGFIVAVADIDSNRAAETVDAIAGAGATASTVDCDVADHSSIKAAVKEVAGRHGGIDLLVNNAGFDEPGFFLESAPEQWDRLVKVNLMGVISCTHVIAPLIIERTKASGYGRIVNIASDAGRVGALGEAVYSAAKGGVIAFSKSCARELARDRVTVNAVCPGPAETPMTDAIRTTEIGMMMMDRMARSTPLRRLAQPDEVAAMVSYFASDDARFVTGQVLSVSGGLTMSG